MEEFLNKLINILSNNPIVFDLADVTTTYGNNWFLIANIQGAKEVDGNNLEQESSDQ